MPVVDVLNLDGKKVGQVELADAIFGAKVNQHLLHEASRWYLRGLRAGTHKTKDKSELAALASRRDGPRAEAARLQLRAAEENAAGRAALGALFKTGGAEA